MVMADGAGTPDEDAAEARAIEEVFGPRGVPVTAPKARTGRLAAGAAPLDVVTALIALREGRCPDRAGDRRSGPLRAGPGDRRAPAGAGRAALVLARAPAASTAPWWSGANDQERAGTWLS
ncbi:hypothetical protein V2I01_33275 [Micromonospora sp. BRA006-A]|nr:hypothetical protein [Micromonospora sp. BRA006-A]